MAIRTKYGRCHYLYEQRSPKSRQVNLIHTINSNFGQVFSGRLSWTSSWSCSRWIRIGRYRSRKKMLAKQIAPRQSDRRHENGRRMALLLHYKYSNSTGWPGARAVNGHSCEGDYSLWYLTRWAWLPCACLHRGCARTKGQMRRIHVIRRTALSLSL